MISSLEDALEALLYFSDTRSRGHVALDAMKQAMDLLGNPQERLRAIHITGTSGKTSTAYFLRQILEDSGKRTGLTVSPHIVAINERVQIGGVPLDEETFCRYASQAIDRLEPLRGLLTYFEVTISLALWIFAMEEVDYAIVEVGIGGARDATNILRGQDKISVIGPVGLDHTEKLGHTIPEIATQKAGILVSKGVGFVADQSSEAVDTIMAHADSIGARAVVVSPVCEDLGAALRESGQEHAELIPRYQWRNWTMAVVVATYAALRDGFSLPEYMRAETDDGASEHALDQIVEAILTATPPARFEWFTIGSHKVLLDGAHNPQKMSSLVAALKDQGIGLVPVLATLSRAPHDKIVETFEVLAPAVSHLIIPSFQLGHDEKVKVSIPAPDAARIAQELGIEAEVVCDLREGLTRLLERDEQAVVITGSLYLAALIRPMLVHLSQ